MREPGREEIDQGKKLRDNSKNMCRKSKSRYKIPTKIKIVCPIANNASNY